MTEQMVAVGDAQVCAEAFGDPADPPVLLVMGRMASMLWWPQAFCERLAAGGRHVIRYDHRDTGRSTAYPPGKPGYGMSELVSDPIAVLDGYGIERAHVVGFSMGGVIAQLLTLAAPTRVETLTAISTTPAGPVEVELPSPSQEYLDYAATIAELNWEDTGAVIEMTVRDTRALGGTRPFDETAMRAHVTRDMQRSRNPASLSNHALINEDGPQPVLAELKVPLLVIHGDADALFPAEHGRALADAVPDARFILLKDAGHELHEQDWPTIVDALLRHTSTT